MGRKTAKYLRKHFSAMMDRAQHGPVYGKLSKELPPVKDMGWDENYAWVDQGMKVFRDEKDREQFIHAVIAVATSNGLLDLQDQDFQLLYARREDRAHKVVARIVAVKDGVIKAKIDPSTDGADQREAFRALKRDVEVKLDRILQRVPDRVTASSLATMSIEPVDAPPAYGSPSVSVLNSKTR